MTCDRGDRLAAFDNVPPGILPDPTTTPPCHPFCDLERQLRKDGLYVNADDHDQHEDDEDSLTPRELANRVWPGAPSRAALTDDEIDELPDDHPRKLARSIRGW